MPENFADWHSPQGMEHVRKGASGPSTPAISDQNRAPFGGNGSSSHQLRRGGLSSSERRKLIFDWNETRADYPRDGCLHHLIEAQTQRTPDAIAAQDESRAFTYRELNERANRLAHELQSRGVAPDILVGICLEPSADLLVALLAVMKAGGAYVPLDPSYPAERVAFMVRDSGMQLVISQRKWEPLLPRENLQVLDLEAILSANDQPFQNPQSAARPENLAYVIYTSGSTGVPKGVMVPHRGLVNYLVWAARAYEVEKGDGAPVHSSISFDLTITGLFTPLLVGGMVRMLPANLDSLGSALQRETDFSLVKITPAHLELLCAQRNGDRRPAATRSFIVGGEALFGRSLDFWRRCAPAATLVNEYGPTETVVGCCVYFVPHNRSFNGAIPIGRPIANTQLYVLDEFLEPVAVGEVGELYIAGDGLARGYLNQPELTAQRFVQNPFAAEDENTSARMYQTGDLVRYLPDGNLEFIGRTDDQIKIRGYRIEPREIEAVLLTHPAVREAAVVCLTSSDGDAQLAAYLVQNDASAEAPELQRHLAQHLPDYMLPAIFVTLPKIPLTPNGKIDRKALPVPEPKKVARGKSSGRTTQKRLLEIWRSALQREVAPDDNFFELGGHSLLAVRLVAQINETLRSNLDALTFYRYPTVRELAELLEREESNRQASGLILARPGRGGPSVIFLHPPLEFVRMTSLMQGDEAFYISEVPFTKEVLEAAQRYDTSIFPSLREIVDGHTALIRAANLTPPIFLAGYSSYGTVAFEIAHELLQAGVAVGGVFLFDADMKTPRWQQMKVVAARHMRRTRDQGIKYLWNKSRERLSRRDGTGVPLEDATPEASLVNGEMSWRIFQRIWDHALRSYYPRPLATHGVLFRAHVTIYGDVHNYDGCLGWRDLFREGLTVIDVPGDHVSMWQEPDVRNLSRLWEASLQKLRAGTAAVICSAPTVLAAIACSV